MNPEASRAGTPVEQRLNELEGRLRALETDARRWRALALVACGALAALPFVLRHLAFGVVRAHQLTLLDDQSRKVGELSGGTGGSSVLELGAATPDQGMLRLTGGARSAIVELGWPGGSAILGSTGSGGMLELVDGKARLDGTVSGSAALPSSRLSVGSAGYQAGMSAASGRSQVEVSAPAERRSAAWLEATADRAMVQTEHGPGGAHLSDDDVSVSGGGGLTSLRDLGEVLHAAHPPPPKRSGR